MAIRVAYLRLHHKERGFYVAVQRGYPNLVVAADKKKCALIKAVAWSKNGKLKEWARAVRATCNPEGK